MIRLIDGTDGLKNVRHACNDLADHSRSPLLRFEWLESCARFSYPSGALKIVVVESRNGIDGIAPFGSVRGIRKETLETLGSSLPAGPEGILYRNRPALEELVEAVMQLSTPIHIRGIKSASMEAFIIESALKRYGLRYYLHREGVPWLPMSGAWEHFEMSALAEGLSGPALFRKAVEIVGNYRVEFSSPSQESIDTYLRQLGDLGKRMTHRPRKMSLLFNDNLFPIFCDFAKTAAELGFLRIATLRIGDVIAAVQFGLEYSDKFWSMGIITDSAYSGCHLEILLTHEVIRYAFANNIEAIECVDGTRTWLGLWTNHAHDLSNYWICGSTAESVVTLGKVIFSSMVDGARAASGRISGIDVSGF